MYAKFWYLLFNFRINSHKIFRFIIRVNINKLLKYKIQTGDKRLMKFTKIKANNDQRYQPPCDH